jgi:hypothetical protein
MSTSRRPAGQASACVCMLMCRVYRKASALSIPPFQRSDLLAGGGVVYLHVEKYSHLSYIQSIVGAIVLLTGVEPLYKGRVGVQRFS